MSGVAAVVAGSRAHARRASTAAASNRAAARLEDASYFGKHHMDSLFARHDTSGTGQLTQAQLKLLLEEVNGEPLSQPEVRYVLHLADQDHDASRKRVSAAMVVLALVLALYFPEIDALLGLLGATCSVSLSFVVPPLLYRRHVVELEAHPRVRRERVLVGVLMTFGAAVAAASVPVTMWELVATVRAR